ncbi:unnamed protein product, partial [Brassica rapa]
VRRHIQNFPGGCSRLEKNKWALRQLKKMFKLTIYIAISQAEPPKLMLSGCVMKPKRKT